LRITEADGKGKEGGVEIQGKNFIYFNAQEKLELND
jgi:hypothetical protein